MTMNIIESEKFRVLMEKNGALEMENLQLRDQLARYEDNFERAKDAWKTLNEALS